MEDALKEIQLLIPLATYRKIMAYASICETEISGFADVEYNIERNVFIAGEVYLPEQDATEVAVHFEEETMSKFMMERIEAGAKQLPRIWWHSHVDMTAYLSRTDEDTLEELQNETFIIALVVNKKKEMAAKAYVCVESETTVFGETIKKKEWIAIDPLIARVELEYERIPETLKKEVGEKVKKKEYQRSFYKGRKALIKGGKVVPNLFPKDLAATLQKIEKLNLHKEWDEDLNREIWVSEFGGIRYMDFWGVLEDESLKDEEEFYRKLEEDAEKEEEGRKN